MVSTIFGNSMGILYWISDEIDDIDDISGGFPARKMEVPSIAGWFLFGKIPSFEMDDKNRGFSPWFHPVSGWGES